MWKSIDIGRVLKLLLVVAVSMFMLTACASDDKKPGYIAGSRKRGR